jgi:hypothetical protein
VIVAQLIKGYRSWVKVEVLLLCAQDLASGPYPISLLLFLILSFHLNKISQEVYSLQVLLLSVAFCICPMYAACPTYYVLDVFTPSVFQEVKTLKVLYT